MKESFRTPGPIEKDPYFYICGGRYAQCEVECMGWDEFCMLRNGSVPQKLYKYYSNEWEIKEGVRVNYSQEALKNGTVYLQNIQYFDDNYDSLLSVDFEAFAKARISMYADLFGINYRLGSDYAEILFELSKCLYNQILAGVSIDEILMKVNSSIDSKKPKISHEIFLKDVFISLIKEKDRDDCWQRAFQKAIEEEYKNVTCFTRQFRVACFSESPYLVDMWSRQYANNHHGFCIEYQLPEYINDQRILNLFPVIYSDNRKDLLETCISGLEDNYNKDYLIDVYKYGLLAKSKTLWKNQREWRLISPDNMLADNYVCKFFPITKVYLGQKMDKNERREIIKICEENGFPYVGVKPMTFEYEMMECLGNCKECVNRE